MALNQQEINIIGGIVQSLDSLYEAADRLRSLQQGAIDSGLGQPADQDLIDAGFDWFSGADIVAAFGQIAPILATLDGNTLRAAINQVRRFP